MSNCICKPTMLVFVTSNVTVFLHINLLKNLLGYIYGTVDTSVKECDILRAQILGKAKKLVNTVLRGHLLRFFL